MMQPLVPAVAPRFQLECGVFDGHREVLRCAILQSVKNPVVLGCGQATIHRHMRG